MQVGMRRHTGLVISLLRLGPTFRGLACPDVRNQSGVARLRFLPFVSRIIHEEHPRATASHATFVTKQGHLEIIEGLEKTGVVGGWPLRWNTRKWSWAEVCRSPGTTNREPPRWTRAEGATSVCCSLGDYRSPIRLDLNRDQHLVGGVLRLHATHSSDVGPRSKPPTRSGLTGDAPCGFVASVDDEF